MLNALPSKGAAVMLMLSWAKQRNNNHMIVQAMRCLGLIFILMQFSCSKSTDTSDHDRQKKSLSQAASKTSEKKVLLVNSYHQDYFWTGGITDEISDQFAAARDLQGGGDNSENQVILKIIDMDTKRNPSEEYIKQAALDVKKTIEDWCPDLVITTDDNAAKYLIVPYYINSDLPFVFCGINWDAAEYGFPASNVTGMIEVQLVDQIILTLKKYARGDRVAFLKGDDFSARKEADFFEKTLHIQLEKRFVKNFSEWTHQYRLLQEEADIILVGNSISIPDWDSEKAEQLVDTVTKVPTGNWDDAMKHFNLLTFATKPEEQGEWAAKTALKILNGKSPAEIPLAANKKARVILNMKLARNLGLKFPIELIDQATLIPAP